MSFIVRRLFYKFISLLKLNNRNGKLPFLIIVGLTAYVPLEDFFLKLLPISSSFVTVIRLLPECLLYFLLLVVIYQRLSSGYNLRKTPIDIIIIVFFISSIISIVINQADIFESIVNLRTNWRYLSVYYIVVNLDISIAQITQILKTIQVLGLLQAYLSSIQFFLPDNINKSLFVRPDTKASLAEIKPGSTFGTFPSPANLSSFLLLTSTVFFAYAFTKNSGILPQINDIIHSIVLFFGIFATKKRASLVIAIIVPLLILFFLKKTKNLSIILWLSTTFGFLFIFLNMWISPLISEENIFEINNSNYNPKETQNFSYFSILFSEDYWNKDFQNSRGFIVSIVCSSIIKSASWFGFGPSLSSVEIGIDNALSLLPDERIKLSNVLYVLDDPYWFAVLAYFGIVGLLLYWLIFLRLYQTSNFLIRFSARREYKLLGVIFCSVCVLLFLYSFVERILRLRACTFYFWLLAGLIVNACHAEKSSLRK
jgi:hypothetical protein